MVSFDFVSGSFGNLNAAKSSGWELTAEIRPLRRLILRGTGTFLHTQDDAGRRLLRRPPHTYAAQIIAKPINGLDLSFELLSVGDRTDFGPTGRVTNKGYVRADVAASYRFYRHFRAFGRLGNIADVKYEDVKTFPAQGVNFLGGLEFSWRF
jgi:outer membrane cobalamin receptor